MEKTKNRKPRKRLLTVVLVTGTVAACALVVFFWENIEQFRNWGYASAFLFGFVAGSSLPLPLPYLIVTFSLGGVMNPALVGLASGLGAGIGGSLVYLFGIGSSFLIPGANLFKPCPDPEEATKAQRLYAKFHQWTHQRGSLVVFLMSAIFNPLFAPMAIAIGALRFGFWRFFLWCTLGNLVKSLLIAYCGYFGLSWIVNWQGG